MAAITVRDTLTEIAERESRPREARERVFTARVLPIRQEEVTPVLSVFGEVRARRTLDLRAPISGRVLELADGVENGASVRAGQRLIRLDPSDARAARDLAVNDLARAEAELADAARALELAALDRAEAEAQADLRERAFERRRTLQERGVATEAAIEEAELAWAAARAAVIARRQAEAQTATRLAQAETNLQRQQIAVAEAERRMQDTEIFAAFDGVLADVAVVEGGVVAGNERLARLIDPDALEVAFRLSTEQYLRLLDADGALIPATGEIALELGGLEITSPARLVRASAAVAEGQSGRIVYAEIDAPRGFRPGDFVIMRVNEPALSGVALLPASAVDADGGVLLLAEGDRLEDGRVERLRQQESMVLVRAPDLEGREVVAVRTPLLGAGIRVRPQRDIIPGAAVISEAPEMVAIDPARRAALIERVAANTQLPEQVRTRILAQLEQDQVPAQLLDRLEAGQRGG
jgi:multidrug efflux pump subunit AcrA (membrane-fusion protein)